MRRNKLLVLSVLAAASLALPAAVYAEAVPETEEETVSAADAEEDSVTELEIVEGEKLVLCENEYASVILQSVEDDDVYVWYLVLENKTESSSLLFSADDVVVNGYCIDPGLGTSVEAGEQEESDMTWYPEDFQAAGFDEATSVDFTIKVTDYDDVSKDPYINEHLIVYPQGKENAEFPEYEITEDDVILADTDSLLFVITGEESDEFTGYELSVYVENRADVKTKVAWNHVSVNGYAADPYWQCEVPAHAKAVGTIEWSTDSLDKHVPSDEDISGILFTLKQTYEADWWAFEDYFNEQLAYYPDGEENYRESEREPGENDQLLIDIDEMKLTFIGTTLDDFFGYMVDVLMENKTEEELMISVEDASINGESINSMWAYQLFSGAKAIEVIPCMFGNFEDSGISVDDIETIELHLRVTKAADWMAGPIFDDTVTIRP